MTFARALIVTGKGKGMLHCCLILVSDREAETALLDALQYLQIAEEDYTKLKMGGALVEVKSYIIMIYDRLGRFEERDAAATAHAALLAEEGSGESFDLEAVHRLVEDVGVVLASGLEPPLYS